MKTNSKKIFHPRLLRAEYLESRMLLTTINLGNIIPIGNSITESFDVEGSAPEPATGEFRSQYGVQYELFKRFVDSPYADFSGDFIGLGDAVINNRFRDCFEISGSECTKLERNDPNNQYSNHEDHISEHDDNPEDDQFFPVYPQHNGHDFESEWGNQHQGFGGIKAGGIENTIGGQLNFLATIDDCMCRPDIALLHIGTNDIPALTADPGDIVDVGGIDRGNSHNS